MFLHILLHIYNIFLFLCSFLSLFLLSFSLSPSPGSRPGQRRFILRCWKRWALFARRYLPIAIPGTALSWTRPSNSWNLDEGFAEGCLKDVLRHVSVMFQFFWDSIRSLPLGNMSFAILRLLWHEKTVEAENVAIFTMSQRFPLQSWQTEVSRLHEPVQVPEEARDVHNVLRNNAVMLANLNFRVHLLCKAMCSCGDHIISKILSWTHFSTFLPWNHKECPSPEDSDTTRFNLWTKRMRMVLCVWEPSCFCFLVPDTESYA